MTDPLDEFTQQLQADIYADAEKTYGPVVFERWRRPLYMGSLDRPDGYGRVTGSCGDTMQIFLKFENDRVQQASFITDGCGTSTVCGSFAAELSLAKTPDDIVEITGDTILKILGDLPEEERHCAFLAAETLQAAVADYLQRQVSSVSRRRTAQAETHGTDGQTH
jgi:nitrogen fixation NifU-like protein